MTLLPERAAARIPAEISLDSSRVPEPLAASQERRIARG